MNKRPKAKAVPVAVVEQPARKVAEVDPVPEPEPRRFMPRDCTQCVTRRKPGESYVRVYSKHGRIRYCRCSLCGHTWAQEGE